MGDAPYPIFNNYMIIIVKVKAYGGGGGIIPTLHFNHLKSIVYLFDTFLFGIRFGIHFGVLCLTILLFCVIVTT